jgi:L-2,4-diaminobutyrate decarboxylase
MSHPSSAEAGGAAGASGAPPAPAEALRAAYSPQAFRAQGHALVDQLADYLAQAQAGQLPVLPAGTPDELVARWPAPLAEEPGPGLLALLPRILAESNHLHHPRYIGHQVSAPLPVSALCELVSALLNNGMAVFEMGPVAVAMERQLSSFFAAQLGLPAATEGIFTSGGSVGNLTALLAARQARAGFDSWEAGLGGGPPLAILAADQAHYCVPRAAKVMGLGAGGVIPVPTDDQFRLRPEALPAALAEAARRGRRVFAVVASAGSTATGAFDPLPPIADFCAAHRLWLHVDGAHGAAAALSPRYRHLVAGIERADSVVLDAHKMLLQPALLTLVLFRDGRDSYATFAQRASYLFAEPSPAGAPSAKQPPAGPAPAQAPPAPPEWWNPGLRTLECTKKMMILKLFVSLSQYGTRLFADYVTATFDLARAFAARLRAAGDFTVSIEPAANIVCFRYTPAGSATAAELDALQDRIRQRLLQDGSFYLVKTRLPTGVHLRTTLINPLTTLAELDALLVAIRSAAGPASAAAVEAVDAGRSKF